MDTTTTVIVVAVVVVLLIVAVAALLAARRKKTHRREQAAEVRAEAATHTGTISSTREELAVAESRADMARVEAERAEREAAEARRELDMDRALQEDRVREADAIDPDVDHRADDYEPTLDQVEDYESEPGRHRTT